MPTEPEFGDGVEVQCSTKQTVAVACCVLQALLHATQPAGNRWQPIMGWDMVERESRVQPERKRHVITLRAFAEATEALSNNAS